MITDNFALHVNSHAVCRQDILSEEVDSVDAARQRCAELGCTVFNINANFGNQKVRSGLRITSEAVHGASVSYLLQRRKAGDIASVMIVRLSLGRDGYRTQPKT